MLIEINPVFTMITITLFQVIQDISSIFLQVSNIRLSIISGIELKLVCLLDYMSPQIWKYIKTEIAFFFCTERLNKDEYIAYSK